MQKIGDFLTFFLLAFASYSTRVRHLLVFRDHECSYKEYVPCTAGCAGRVIQHSGDAVFSVEKL